MRRAPCDRLWQLAEIRAGRLLPGDVASFERHRPTCVHCTGAAAYDQVLDRLIAAAPDRSPTELELRRLRVRVLADAAMPPSRRAPLSSWTAAAVAIALALTLTGLAVGWRARAQRAAVALAAPPREPFAGTVSATAGAAWTQTRDAGTEHVRLDDGAIAVHVRKQQAGERFLVILPDGELEVRGTSFDVVVRGRRTERVAVSEGLVALRVDGTERLLAAGESWPAAPPPAAASSGAIPPAPPSIARAGATPPAASKGHAVAPPAGARDLAEYAAAMALYRAGAFDDAAEAFQQLCVTRAATLAPDLVDDASFLEASALARAGRADAAALAAERHMSRFPASFHRSEDALFVARAARDRGACAKALRLLDDAGVTGAEGAAVRRACAPSGLRAVGASGR